MGGGRKLDGGGEWEKSKKHTQLMGCLHVKKVQAGATYEFRGRSRQFYANPTPVLITLSANIRSGL